MFFLDTVISNTVVWRERYYVSVEFIKFSADNVFSDVALASLIGYSMY